LAVRLRLRRMGKKKKPFYRIVAIDSREARNGKYLEKVGHYNPISEPVEIDVKVDRALYWLQNGAQPSDTVRSLLKKRGVMMRFDLIKRGKSSEEIDSEITKWESQQMERQKRIEAAAAQARRDLESGKKSEKSSQKDDSGEKEAE